MEAPYSQTGFKRNWFTITSLVSKDFKRKYRRSILGVVWSVLNPLLMMCVLTAVFSAFFRFNIENYPLYLILGTTLFSLMSGSTNQAMKSIINSASLIKKVRINKIVFPVERVLFELVNYAISLIAVAIVLLFFQVEITWNVLLVPFLLIYVLMFSLGIGLLLSALAVFFRDLVHLWGVVITAWTYATPIFYPADILPDWMLAVEAFNPMFHYVTYMRDVVLWGITPDLLENVICLGFGVITLIVGYIVFKATERKFILYV